MGTVLASDQGEGRRLEEEGVIERSTVRRFVPQGGLWLTANRVAVPRSMHHRIKRLRNTLGTGVLVVVMSILAVADGAFAAWLSQGNGYGPLIDRAGAYDYEPAAVRITSTQLRVWTCSRSPNVNEGDAIFLTIFNTDHPTSAGNIVYPSPSVGSWPSLLPSPDLHACSPAVIQAGAEYRMYYECSTPSAGIRPDICLARSANQGTSWVQAGRILFSPPGGVYGIGHLSAVLNRHDRSETLLYYYDDTCREGPQLMCPIMRGRRLAPDGITSRGEFRTNLSVSPWKVKYYDPAWTGGTGYFIATRLGTPGYFEVWTSTDGITFQPAGSLAIPGFRCGEDPGRVVADADGWIRSPTWDLQVMIGADSTGCGNPAAWGVYLTRFGIHLP